MFNPKTERIKQLANKYSRRINKLETIFSRKTNVYIDFTNVKPWSNKLNWHIDLKRLKQFLDSFSEIKSVKIYNGILVGNKESENFNQNLLQLEYILKTKPVKIMRKSIDVSSIPKKLFNNFGKIYQKTSFAKIKN